jgi:hypothetical protein
MSNYELFGPRGGPFYVADTDRRVRRASFSAVILLFWR